MKNILIGVLILSAFASCKKANLAPLNPTSSTGGTSTQPSTNYAISFVTPDQVVATNVKNDTLVMVYHENVSLVLNPEEYASSWAVHLIETFDGTTLSGVDYTTVNPQGIAVHNVVDNNMNNVILKSVSDTTVNGAAKKVMRVFRNFTFSKVYDSNAAAISEQNKLVGTKEQMSFSAYYYADAPTIISTNSTIVYTKDSSK